ncbi:MAG: LOG family protein [Magnetospiraceae bacterium]
MQDMPSGPKKAYFNEAFLRGKDARPLRILAEYLEPESRFERYKVRDTIVFMGSARTLPQDVAEAALSKARAEGGDVEKAERDLHMSRYYEASRALAAKVTEWSKDLKDPDRRFVVCTGGGPGIMEAANRGASEAKGINLGFNISLPMEQNENPYTTRELCLEFHYFFMRKFWFAYLAKAMVIFPGGFGTFDELFEVLTLLQTQKIQKRMPVVLFGTEYWNEVVNLPALAKWGTIDARDLDLMFTTDSVDDAFDYLASQLTEYALDQPGAGL